MGAVSPFCLKNLFFEALMISFYNSLALGVIKDASGIIDVPLLKEVLKGLAGEAWDIISFYFDRDAQCGKAL